MKRRATALLLGFALLPACGGDDSGPTGSSTPPPTTTPPAVRTVLTSGSQSGLGSFILLAIPFEAPARGTLDVTVDWTFPSSLMAVYLSPGTCTIEQINGGTCQFLIASETLTPKPKVLQATITTAGSYTLYIGNAGSVDESVSWQVGLTTGGAASTSRAVARSTVAWRGGDVVR